jgi:alpha-L-rhamnosidase
MHRNVLYSESMQPGSRLLIRYRAPAARLALFLLRLPAGVPTVAVLVFTFLAFQLQAGNPMRWTAPASTEAPRWKASAPSNASPDVGQAFNSLPRVEETGAAYPGARQYPGASSQVYFPYIAGQPLFYQDPAIWSSPVQRNVLYSAADVPTAAASAPVILNANPKDWSVKELAPAPGAPTALTGEARVSLFRHRFYPDEDLQQTELVIFADTRYQVWLDGEWVGRGPARFSLSYREYDIFPLGNLPAGEHVLAVLVQWAPNIRRAESSVPLLRAHLQGNGKSGVRRLARTSSEWRTLETDAWQSQSALVHAWNLIGPTELLDLRRLPVDWFTPNFDDAGWGYATLLEAGSLDPAAEYAPRSIPNLVEYSVSPLVAGAGRLSPGFLLGEFLPSTGVPAVTYTVPLTVTTGLTVTLEILQESLPPTVSLTVDGAALVWLPARPVGQADSLPRPDVYTTSLYLESGSHQILLNAVPAAGMAVAIAPSPQSNPALQVELPFQQGLHAGHRLLLANPQPDPAAVIITPGADLSVSFESLPGYIILDLGRTIHGRLAAQVSGPPGAVLDIGWDERLTPGGRPLPYPGINLHPQWNQVDSWILDGSQRPISTLDARAGRYILIAAWGVGPIKLQQITVTEERYPALQTGFFLSSDSQLNTIWQTGIDTMRPNMTDAYTDTPWRERGQWWGDAYVGILANRAAFGDTLLWKRSLRLMANALVTYEAPGMAPHPNDTHMLDYAMLWVDSLAVYTRVSGDLAEATHAYRQVSGLVQHLGMLENDSTGLLDLPQLHWSQTAYIDSLGQDSRYGQSTALNALYTQALRAAAEIARYNGDASTAGQWESKAETLRQAINQHLYQLTEGRYLSTLYQGQPVAPTPHAQAWALAYGIPDAGEQDRVAQALLDLLSPDPANPNLNILGFNWVLEGLGRSGHIDQALDLIALYYGSMLDKGATTWWEQFAADADWRTSLSHAWGVSPTWFLSSYVLGATQTSPSTWEVRPPFAASSSFAASASFSAIQSVQGAIPIQNNPGRVSILEVSWQRSCSRATLQVGAPAGTQGEIILPRMPAGTLIWVNGVPVDQNGELHIPASPGSLLVEIEPGC